MMRKITILLVIVSFISGWCVTEEFVQRRVKKKGPSMATLKEECCRGFGEVLKLVPPFLRKISKVQDHAVCAIQGYWEGDKESFCGQASQQKLEICNERLKKLQANMQEMLKEFELCITALKKP